MNRLAEAGRAPFDALIEAQFNGSLGRGQADRGLKTQDVAVAEKNVDFAGARHGAAGLERRVGDVGNARHLHHRMQHPPQGCLGKRALERTAGLVGAEGHGARSGGAGARCAPARLLLR